MQGFNYHGDVSLSISVDYDIVRAGKFVSFPLHILNAGFIEHLTGRVLFPGRYKDNLWMVNLCTPEEWKWNGSSLRLKDRIQLLENKTTRKLLKKDVYCVVGDVATSFRAEGIEHNTHLLFLAAGTPFYIHLYVIISYISQVGCCFLLTRLQSDFLRQLASLNIFTELEGDFLCVILWVPPVKGMRISAIFRFRGRCLTLWVTGCWSGD